MNRPDDDRTVDALRRALARQASAVHPAGDGLSRIRARTACAGRQRWLVPVAAAASAVAVAGGVAYAVSTQGVDRDPVAHPGPSTTASTSASVSGDPSATTPVATGGPPTDVPTATPTATLPVYYLGAQPRLDAPDAYKVFREYHRVAVPDVDDRAERVVAAVTEMLRQDPLDPDYTALWPADAAVLSAQVDADAQLVTVDLTGLAWGDARLPDGRPVADVGDALLQQLVYTATAAASMIDSGDDFSARHVQVLVDGAPVDTLLGVGTAEPLERDPGGSQALIWITEPEWQDVVAAGDVTVRLVANLFEGAGQWELRRDGVVVDEGLVPQGEGGVWDSYEFAVPDVAPGTYELEVFDVGGLGVRDVAPSDTKTFVVG